MLILLWKEFAYLWMWQKEKLIDKTEEVKPSQSAGVSQKHLLQPRGS